jgi:hypothetical protein
VVSIASPPMTKLAGGVEIRMISGEKLKITKDLV